MPNQIVLEGFEDFKAMLAQLPDTLAEEAEAIVEHYAEITASSIRQAYPIGDTGKLRRGVKIQVLKRRFVAGRTVRSTSPAAHLWEFGTQNRVTRQGWRRGRMPAHKPEGLVAIAVRNRRAMVEALIAMLQKQPFEVTTRGI